MMQVIPEAGIVSLKMEGACGSCPSSQETLKLGCVLYSLEVMLAVGVVFVWMVASFLPLGLLVLCPLMWLLLCLAGDTQHRLS